MDFKKKFDSPIKLLIFYLTIFWIGVGTIIIIVSRYASVSRSELLNTKLQIINDYLSFSHYSEDPQNRKEMINFLNEYFKKQENYDGLIVNIFDVNGPLMYSSDSMNSAHALPLSYPEVRNALRTGHDYTTLRMDKITHKPTFFSATYNKEKNLVIITKIPYTSQYLNQFTHEKKLMLIIVLFIGVLFTFVIIFYTLKYNRKLDLINLISTKIKKGEPIEIPKNISGDKLGEITLTVINLYQEKIQYLEEKENERIKAIEIEKNNLTAKRILLNNLKHEFKTPLGIIQGYIETLLYHKHTPVEMRERFLENCLKNIKRLEKLLESTTLLTRMEDGRESILIDKVELYPIVKEIFDDMAPQLYDKHIKFNLLIPQDIIIKSNSFLIEPLFHNLIQNAINYSKCSKIELKVEDEDDQYYTFSFSDNGIGVKEENIQKLFQRFFREDKATSRAQGGSGLGLSIVATVVKMQGGVINVENQSTGGLKFTFTLPKFI